MTLHRSSNLLSAVAAGWVLVIAGGPLAAAERGPPPGGGGLRQQPPMSPPFDSRSRIPGQGIPDPGSRMPGPGPGIKGSTDLRRLPPQDQAIPDGTSITHRGTRYRVTDGRWYEQRGRDLVAVTPPAGVMVRDLPQGYSMRWIGGVPFFYADGLYFVWRERPRRYEIVQTPAAEGAGP